MSTAADSLIETAIRKATDAAESRLEECFASLDDVDLSSEYKMSAPFCGCTTCVVREVLDSAWPYLRLAAIVDAEDS